MNKEDKNFNTEEDFSDLSIDELLASVYADLDDMPELDFDVESVVPETEPVNIPEAEVQIGQETLHTATAVEDRPAVPAEEAEREEPIPALAEEGDQSPSEDEEFEAEKAAPVKKKGRFGRGLLIYAAVLVVAIAGGLAVFWQFLSSYEAAQPERTVENFLTSVDDAYWTEGILAASRIGETEFEQKELLQQELYLDKVLNNELTWRRLNAEYTDEKPVYVVRAAGTDFCRLTLGRGEDVGFGFSGWNVTEARLMEAFLDQPAMTLTITVPVGSTVTLNGVTVGEDYLLDRDAKYEDVYEISGLYKAPEIVVIDRDGEELEPLQAENDEYLYPIPETKTFTFRITVPAGAVVLVEDEPIAEEFAPETVMPEVFGEDIAEYADDSAAVDVYEFEGNFYELPVVTATDAEGRELEGITTEDGDYIFAAVSDEELENEHKERVETFFRAYVNFSANIGNDSTANFYKISPLILPNSDLYDHIYAAIEPMTWVGGATVEYKELVINSFVPSGENCFTCRVSYLLTNETYYDVREVSGVYDLVFVRSNGVWYAASMLEVG